MYCWLTFACLLCEQFRRLVCERLASVVRIRSNKSPDDLGSNKGLLEMDVLALNTHDVNVSTATDVNHHEPKPSPSSSPSPPSSSSAAAAAGKDIGSVKSLLSSILDVLETRQSNDVELLHRQHHIQQMMSEWRVAAAVIDRISFCIIAFLVITATLAFIILLLVHPWPASFVAGNLDFL